MSPRVFIVVLDEEGDSEENVKAVERLNATFDTFPLSSTVVLVRAEKVLTGDVAKVARTVGPDLSKTSDEGVVAGVVFKLTRTASGYYWSQLWEWLEQEEVSA